MQKVVFTHNFLFLTLIDTTRLVLVNFGHSRQSSILMSADLGLTPESLDFKESPQARYNILILGDGDLSYE